MLTQWINLVSNTMTGQLSPEPSLRAKLQVEHLLSAAGGLSAQHRSVKENSISEKPK